MLLLGSERLVTQNFKLHKKAEDYAGSHLSIIKISGRAKVLKIINKFKYHEDSINYHDYLNNKVKWRDGTYFNCISITGKTVRYHQSELGGNQVSLECYDNERKRIITICHMAEVLVNTGDIIDSNTIIGKQGNTGLVLSSKSKSDISYGSHVHMEVIDENNQYIDPRTYATFEKEVDYTEQTNALDDSKSQIKIIATSINIREQNTTNSKIIGKVFYGEIYDVINISEDDKYTWYNIKTNRGLIGYVANEKGKNWVLLAIANEPIEDGIEEADENKKLKLIFICNKDGTYAISLKNGERLYLK